jgi:hypothetical protein
MVVCRLWHLCQPRYPRFVHFSWSFPVNWYIQSILLYPAIKSVTFVSASPLHSHAQLQTCLPIPNLHTCQWHPNPHAEHSSLSSTTAICHFSSVLLVDPCCRRNTTRLVHVMTCIHPPSFFLKVLQYFSSHLGELCTFHSCSLRCFSSFMTPPCIASRCLLAVAPLS